MRRAYIILLAAYGFWSCGDESFDATDSFTKIYDHSSAEVAYHPIDMVKTEEGFLILAATQLDESDFSGVQVIQLDEKGDFVAEQTADVEYVAPVGGFMQVDTGYFFFAMHEPTLSTVLISVTPTLSGFNIATAVAGPSYPLAGSVNDADELLVLTYNPEALQTVISRVSADGTFLQGIGYTIGAGSDVEAQIISHFVDNERSGLPFFCGELAGTGQVYFNGFYNYTLSLVFSSFGDAPDGVLQGQATDGGVSAAMPVIGSNFSLVGFQFNDNFVTPAATLDPNGINSSIDLAQGTISELKSRSKADIVLWENGGNQYVVVAAETQNRQVVLYIYDYASGQMVGIERIGYQNAFTLSSIKVDDENALLVLGSTYVSGRFERAFLKKLSADQLKSFIQ
ncbi:hypothetical protein [Marinoscillum sp. MHG1-6]|uniref:hypothetical protein n=1 Tax=Marinoscillum sp. MHG1-6 TaxID=2959627 RepID=UPI002158479F|nr:hypothetical protein [Marinoscillum sp. MHG1-6]